MVTHMTSPHTPKISLKIEVWDLATERVGLVTDKAKAEALGHSRAYVNRVQNRHIAPSNDFMAAACDVLGLGLDDLFVVHRKTAKRAA